jgi:hypothetical protein
MFCNIPYSMDNEDRLFRGHGHTLNDIVDLRFGKIERLPDLIVWPSKFTAAFLRNILAENAKMMYYSVGRESVCVFFKSEFFRLSRRRSEDCESGHTAQCRNCPLRRRNQCHPCPFPQPAGEPNDHLVGYLPNGEF